MTDTPVGVQLWTLRDACAADLPRALERVARAGYRWIEPYDFYGHSAADLAGMLNAAGLGTISSHVSLDLLKGDLDRVMDDHESLGCRTIVCPWLDEEMREDPGVFDKVGRFLHEIAPRLAERGFDLLYHNHEFEFTLCDNPDGLHRILAQAGPVPVRIQLDTFWLGYTGRDPVAYMRELGPDLASVHLKDGRPAEEKFTPVGSGELDMPAIVRAGLELGVRSFVVEQDEHEGDPFDSIGRSLEFLRSLGLDL